MTYETIHDIAKRVLKIETLETRGEDKLDFHTLPVWKIRSALIAAFLEGQQVQIQMDIESLRRKYSEIDRPTDDC